MSPQFGGRRSLLDPAGERATYDHDQRRMRIIGRIVVGFLALVVLVTAGVTLKIKTILDEVQHKPLASVIPAGSRPVKPSSAPGQNGGSNAGTAQNILILGVDSRLGENATYQVKGAAAQTETLSDTAILAHLSGDGKHVTLISVPRDSVVDIPSCDRVDAQGNPIKDAEGNAEVTKPLRALFNEAIQLGGPACSVHTLEQLTGVYIDHFLEIDFEGVIKMSNALGGVPLMICNPIHDVHTGLNLPAGPVNLKGATALAFVRARYGLTGGDDLHRIQRQQQFMASMARKALASSTLFNLPSMTSFYGDVASSLTTDMSSSQLINLALHYRHIDTSNIVFATVPTYPVPPGDKWHEHLYWSEDEAAALFSTVRDDRPLAATQTGGHYVATVSVAPSLVSVRVLNGTQTNGLAHEVADELTSAGFHVVGYGTATTMPNANTTISYAASRTDSMQTLASALKVAPHEVLNAQSTKTLTLTIGDDWAGLAGPSASASASAPASAPASAAASGSAIPGLKATSASTEACVQG